MNEDKDMSIEQNVPPYRIAALLLVLAALLAPPVLAQSLRMPYGVAHEDEFTLFPLQSHSGEPRWLVMRDGCRSYEFIERPRLTAGSIPTSWRLEVKLRAAFGGCFPELRAFESTTYAVRVPERVGNAAVHVVDVTTVFHTSEGAETGRHQRRYRLEPENGGTSDAISGAWHHPDSPGQGLYVSRTLVPDRLFPTSRGELMSHLPGVMLAWSTFDRDGKPMLLTGIARDGQPVVLHRGGDAGQFGFAAASGGVQRWGQATVQYLGCGRLRFEWTADDAAAYPPGTIELQQLVDTLSAPCDLPALALRQFVTLDAIEPVIEQAPAR